MTAGVARATTARPRRSAVPGRDAARRVAVRPVAVAIRQTGRGGEGEEVEEGKGEREQPRGRSTRRRKVRAARLLCVDNARAYVL